MKKLLLELLVLVFLGTAIFAETGTVLENRVRVRSAPSLTYSVVVGVADKGDKLEVNAKSEESDDIDGFSKSWYRVKFNNKECWIYGGYFSVDSDVEDLLEVSKSSAMSSALFEYYAVFAVNCGAYLRKGKNVRKSYESFTVEGGFKIDAVCYTFEYGPVKIDCYTRDGTYFTWTGTSIVRNGDNPLNIKLGMTMEEVKAVFGDFDSIKGLTAYIYGGGVRVEFIFDDKTGLECINLVQDGC